MHLSVISEPRRGASPRRSCLLPAPCRHRGDAALLVSPLCWVSQSYRDNVGLRHHLILLLLPSALPGGVQQPPRTCPCPEGCAGAVFVGCELCLGQPRSPSVAKGLESGLGSSGPRPSCCSGPVEEGFGELGGPWGTSPSGRGPSFQGPAVTLGCSQPGAAPRAALSLNH